MRKFNSNLNICTLVLLILFSIQESSAKELATKPALVTFAESAQWQRVLHMRDSFFGKESRMRPGKFFLSENGNTDPFAELLVDMKQGEALACEFPARYMILAKQFHWSLKPLEKCHDFHNWVESLDADSLWIIYTAQYLSNPSSAFGHSFIRFSGSKHNELLDLTLGFAAIVPKDVNALEYVYNGLTGGFPGDFSQAPFFGKVLEYGEAESRNMWAYRVNFTKEEFQLTLAHLWELYNKAETGYYFFDDNCSMMLLDALSVARPNVDFYSGFGLYVTPLESVKALVNAGWISEVRHISSLRTRLEQKYNQLDKKQKAEFNRAKDSHGANIDQLKDAKVLETLIDYYDFKKNETWGWKRESDKKTYNNLLVARSKVGGSVEWKPIPEEFNQRPDNSAYPHWFTLSGGTSSEGNFLGVGFNPAVHSLMARDEGFVRFSEVEVLGINARYYTSVGNDSAGPGNKMNHWQLDSLKLFSMVNLVPYESFDQEFAWRITTEITPRKEIARADIERISISPAIGYGFQSNDHKFYTYGLLAASLESGASYGPSLNLYLGPEAGLIFTPKNHFKMHLLGKHMIAATKSRYEANKSLLSLSGFHSISSSFDYGFEFMSATTNMQFPANWSELTLKGRYFF